MKRKFAFHNLLLLAILVSTLAFCTARNHPTEAEETTPTAQSIPTDPATQTSSPPTTLQPAETEPISEPTLVEATPEEPLAGSTITVQADQTTTPINACLLGTNLPAWLGASRLEDETFRARTVASGLTLIRLPGGSWSNWYPWADCEQDNNSVCDSWIADPTDFINFLNATGLAGMWTINANATVEEAAALVAFMNGSTSDTSVIGVDVNGKNWGTVGQWAQLRASHGNPDPVSIQFWEVGNEIYGGKSGMGTDCPSWGWEDVWTCDGTEYVTGIGSGANHHSGFDEFLAAMQAVDPTIHVGAVGIYPQSDYTNWGNEVITAAGNSMDFYIIHQYAYFNVPSTMQEALAQPQSAWQPILNDVDTAFAQHAGGRDVPYAVTEFNLFSVQDLDNGQWMKKAVNALFMADTLGQMMAKGFDIANQWDLANGQAGNGTDYGLMDADSYARAPQYYIYPLWARFGSEMIPVTNPENAATTLSVYAGWVDANTLSVLVINKTGNTIPSNLAINGISGISSGVVDVVAATSLDATSMTYNGASNPSDDLSNAPSTPLSDTTLPVSYTFAPYSITLIRMEVSVTSVSLAREKLLVGRDLAVFLPYIRSINGTAPPPPFTCEP